MNLRRWTVLLVILAWIGVNGRSFSTMSYDWDAAQYSLGTLEFDVTEHQPHPPGYPLWILALRTVAPLAGGAPLAQTVLGLLLTLGALAAFYRLARDWSDAKTAAALTLLLGSSPTVQLHAFAQGTYPVDLLASALLGHLGWRAWRGDATAARLVWPLAALFAGFRPGGIVLLAPLLAAATLPAARRSPWTLAASFGVAVGVFLAWFWPLQASVGGVGRLVELNRDLFGATAGTTSVLMGVDGATGTRVVARLLVILAVALVPLVGVVWSKARPDRERLVFLGLWTAPGLLFVGLVHFAIAGYLLLLLPPLFLALGRYRPSVRTMAPGLIAALILAHLPYEDLPAGKLLRAVRLATPHPAVTAARANRELRRQVQALDAAAVVCDPGFERTAPNVRTVTYDFRDLGGAGAPVHLRRGEAAGPPGAQRVHRGEHFTLWRETP